MREKPFQEVMLKILWLVAFVKAVSSESSTVVMVTVNSTQALPQATASAVQIPVSVNHTNVLSPSPTTTAVVSSSSAPGNNQGGGNNQGNNQGNTPTTRELNANEKVLFDGVGNAFNTLDNELDDYIKDDKTIVDAEADDLTSILKITKFATDIATMTEAFENTGDNSTIDLLKSSSQSVVAIKKLDCLANNGTTFPDKQDKKHLTLEWLKRTDSIYIPFDCPRIPITKEKPPLHSRRRRDVTIDIVLTHEDLQQHVGVHHLRYRRSASNSTNCSVNACAGQWSEYGSWSVCSKTCGPGQQSRTRTCTNPPPVNGGQNCTGNPVETRACTVRECINCGGPIRAKAGETEGFIFSPKYPNTYPSQAECKWIIDGGFNSSVELELVDFVLEKDKKCFYDSLTVFNGNSTNSTDQIGSRLCGRQPSRNYKSTGNVLVVVFRSDETENYKGFNASWKANLIITTPTPPIEYVEQHAIVTSFMYNPFANGTCLPIGKATTCKQGSRETPCIFDLDQFAISRIIFAAINRDDHYFNTSKVILTFEHIMNKELFPKAYIGRKSCVTWNATAQSLTSGGWTRRGGRVMETNVTHTICEFDHLGVFTVLGELRETYEEFSLMTNTYVGFGVSFLILILAVVHIVWKVDFHGGELMRVNICASIIMMEIAFLIGAHVEAEQALCGFLAFLIYFCVLAEFSWLLLHALRIHGKIKKLFAASVNIEIIYVVIGWGAPLLMAAIAGGVQTNIADKKEVCWKAAAGSGMWGYAVPVIVFGLMDAVVLLKLIIPTESVKEQYEYDRMKFRVMKDASLLTLFALTCTMAYWSVFLARFREQFFLCAFVVLQAVAMFVFGREGKKDFMRVQEEKPKEPEPEQKDDKEVAEEKAKEEEEKPEKKEDKEETEQKARKKMRRKRKKPQDQDSVRAPPAVGSKSNNAYA